MVPDYPTTKQQMMKVFTYRLRAKQREYLGYFAKIPAYASHEGHEWTVIRPDGTQSRQEYQEIASEFSVKTDDAPYITPETLLAKIDAIAQDTAGKLQGMIFADLAGATKGSPREIDAKGSPFTKELFLKAFESIQIDFDEGGKIIPPAIIMHPDLWRAKKDEFAEWESDPEFKKQNELLVIRKREEWRARESNRKLVD